MSTAQHDVLEEPLLSIDDIARLFVVSRCTIRRWRAAGALPQGIRVGREWRFPKAAVRQMVTEHSEGANARLCHSTRAEARTA